MKLVTKLQKFFNLMIEALVEARKAKADAVTKGIGR